MFENSWENWVDGTEWESRNIEAYRSLGFTIVVHCKDFVTLRCIVIVGFKFFDSLFWSSFQLMEELQEMFKELFVCSPTIHQLLRFGHICLIILFLYVCVNIKLNHWESSQIPCALTPKCVSFYFIRAKIFSYITIVWLSNLENVTLLQYCIQVSPLSPKYLLC